MWQVACGMWLNCLLMCLMCAHINKHVKCKHTDTRALLIRLVTSFPLPSHCLFISLFLSLSVSFSAWNHNLPLESELWQKVFQLQLFLLFIDQVFTVFFLNLLKWKWKNLMGHT